MHKKQQVFYDPVSANLEVVRIPTFWTKFAAMYFEDRGQAEINLQVEINLT